MGVACSSIWVTRSFSNDRGNVYYLPHRCVCMFVTCRAFRCVCGGLSRGRLCPCVCTGPISKDSCHRGMQPPPEQHLAGGGEEIPSPVSLWRGGGPPEAQSRKRGRKWMGVSMNKDGKALLAGLTSGPLTLPNAALSFHNLPQYEDDS